MMESGVPPGFRFHPTEEELVGYYLKRKISSLKIDLNLITDIDLYNMEPWDIQDRCGRVLGNEVEQKEWYFFSHKDKKYPTGTRTNRATAHGFWKATGRDKAVLSRNNRSIIGMRKTLVFYRGRAPNGRKTDWIIHEYRLQTSEHVVPPQEEGWVVCRAFKKPIPNERPGPGGFEAYYTHSGVQIRHDEYCTPDPDHNVTPLFPNQDFYFQQSIISSTLSDEISREAQGLPPLLDIPTPTTTAISDPDGEPMKQVMASHDERCNFPWFEDYDVDGYGEWKAFNSSLITGTAPEPSSCCSINSDIDHHASHPIMIPRDRVTPAAAHQNQGYYYTVVHF